MKFQEEQERLSRLVEDGKLRFVYLDPDGTWADWLVVVIRQPTGVVYATQCGGARNDQRLVEGYLVPLGGPRFEVDHGPLTSAPFGAVFHRGRHCIFNWVGEDLPSDRLARLVDLISDVPYWHHWTVYDSARERLELDHSRIDELCEAWVPVLTPDGAGVLLYDNCD